MCETMQIAVNSVINWSFFYYGSCKDDRQSQWRINQGDKPTFQS